MANIRIFVSLRANSLLNRYCMCWVCTRTTYKRIYTYIVSYKRGAELPKSRAIHRCTHAALK